MPKPEKNAMALVDACRTPMRRKIMILAGEAKAEGKMISAKQAADKLAVALSPISYHFKVLFEAGALEVVGGEQKRGAWQKHYLPSEDFEVTMTDTVALDQIAELVDDWDPLNNRPRDIPAIVKAIRATGRPVEAARHGR
jgi:predicted ArsR family transcriptional regulator